MSVEVRMTFRCDCPCTDGPGQRRLSCFSKCEVSYHDWAPDGVNDGPAGWYRDIDAERTLDDDEFIHYCSPCWARVQSVKREHSAQER
jgi:hypothetical protein